MSRRRRRWSRKWRNSFEKSRFRSTEQSCSVVRSTSPINSAWLLYRLICLLVVSGYFALCCVRVAISWTEFRELIIPSSDAEQVRRIVIMGGTRTGKNVQCTYSTPPPLTTGGHCAVDFVALCFAFLLLLVQCLSATALTRRPAIRCIPVGRRVTTTQLTSCGVASYGRSASRTRTRSTG